MRFSNRGQGDRAMILELTSMVDIVFLLVIFFMVTSDFARDARAEVSLPRLDGEQMEGMEEAGLYINLDATFFSPRPSRQSRLRNLLTNSMPMSRVRALLW